MFIAGLEIDLNEFIKNKSKGIIFGVITVFIPVVISIPIFYFVFHYSVLASILISSIFVSHTLITYPIVSKLGISKNLAVNISIAGTLIADVSALLILAIVSNSVADSVGIAYWVQFVVSIIIFALVVLLVVPIVGRWFFKKVSDNVLQYIFVLTVVFLSAFMAMLAGLEPIVGAFFSGLALNRLIPHTSPLMNRIGFIGNAIFIPFFLIGVGMLINYHVLFESVSALIITLVISVVALLTKYLAAISTRKILGLTKDQGLLIFGLSGARVAAALAIALIGYNLIIGETPNGGVLRFLDENIFNGVIIMILVTSTVSSFATQQAGKQIAEHDLKTKVYKDSNIAENTLIGLANETTAENLIQLAICTIDKKKKNNLFGLHIITENNENTETINNANKLINSSIKYAASADIRLKSLLRYDLNIASGIINTIKERHIQHFFIGIHEKASILDSFFGNLTSDLLKKSDSSIYISKLFQPINTIKKYILVLPPNTHLESGFIDWFMRIMQISMNTGSKFVVYTNNETHIFLQTNLRTTFKISVDYVFKLLLDFKDLQQIADDVADNSMIIFNLARKNSVSHDNSMDRIGNLINKYFNHVNFILVYTNNFESSKRDGNTFANVPLKGMLIN
jgi:Kef-type K+ transport system membrane component KefB